MTTESGETPQSKNSSQKHQKPEKGKKDPYRQTLLLPKTSFSMRANLLQSEPQFQKHWEHLSLYQKMKENRTEPFVYHDGPPYANGPIHLGHLLNKVLKDLVVRSKTLEGYRVDFTPGWDCHGLPIEHKVLKELGEKAKDLVVPQIRNRCKSYAEKYVKLQAKQMKRLGTIGNYERPYLTLDPAYEAGVLNVFSDLVKAGLVYRAKKPVHWSIENRTALAEAELEYHTRKDPSIYVNFEVTDSSKLPQSLNVPKNSKTHLMIWTTTPWTIPANVAVAVSPVGTYVLCEFKKGETKFLSLVVEDLKQKLSEQLGLTLVKEFGRCKGSELASSSLEYQHPFVEKRKGKVVEAQYVTFEDGTGLVHTAPGHGADDYLTGLKHGLDVICPVLADGTYDTTVPKWLEGKLIWEANPIIVQHLERSGHLVHHYEFEHSYPHDWRSKTPTIFRATEQWFIGVDRAFGQKQQSLREQALASVEETIRFIPSWGKNRLKGMLESRPDWCVSRQRAWGLPIPSFETASGEVLLTAESVKAVSRVIAKKGSDYWFKATPKELLVEYDPKNDPDAPEWIQSGLGKDFEQLDLEKGKDIFDVWFESGSSWNAVLRQDKIGYPADLYLEGSDQHRGWFQHSLLPALGVTEKSPFKVLLTHGFIVDSQGHKMSKSIGNTIDVEALLKKYGADICRWWVSSLNYVNDIKADWSYFQTASEEYRKVRNTIRFMLGNLNDFNPKKDKVTLSSEDATSVDAWMADELKRFAERAVEAYSQFQYKKVQEELFNFCNETLSAVYLAAIKDRLYCEAKDSRKRRRTQTILFESADAVIRLMAPILVHTAEEAYLSLHGLDLKGALEENQSVHLESFPKFESENVSSPYWNEVFLLRSLCLKAIEKSKEKGINHPMDIGIRASVPKDLLKKLQPFSEDCVDLCGVSRFEMIGDESIQEIAGARLEIQDLRDQPRCERSWKRDLTVKARSDGGTLSDRDAQVLGLI